MLITSKNSLNLIMNLNSCYIFHITVYLKLSSHHSFLTNLCLLKNKFIMDPQDVIDLIESLLKVNPEERPYVDWIVSSVDQLINKSAGAV